MKSTPSPARPSVRVPISLLALGLLATGCAVPQFSVAPRIASWSLDGDFRASDSTMTVTSNSDLETMGLDDSELEPGIRADFKFGSPHLVLVGKQVGFSGSGTMDGTVRLGGLTFMGTERVDTEFNLGHYTGLLLFDVIPTKSVDIEAGVGLTMLDFDLELMSLDNPGNNASTDEWIPIPVVGASAAVNIGPVDAALLVSGMSLDVGDAEGTLLDADASVRWKFLGGKNHLRAALLFGWRQTDLDFEYDDGDDEIESDLSLTGPYLGLQFTL